MSAQIDYSIMPIYEDSLSSVSMTVLTGKTDFIKYEANTKFKNILRTALNENNSFNYPFDSLKTVMEPMNILLLCKAIIQTVKLMI